MIASNASLSADGIIIVSTQSDSITSSLTFSGNTPSNIASGWVTILSYLVSAQ